jgi:hypothetical protein
MRFRNSPSEMSGSLPARSRADVEEEPEQQGGSHRQEQRREHGVVVGQQDPEHHEEHADCRQDRSASVERPGRVWRDRVDDASPEEEDYRDHPHLEEERRPPADPGRDDAPVKGPAAAPTPAIPLITPKARARRDIVEGNCREDVDGRYQQAGADTLEHRVAEEQHAEVGGQRAQKGAASEQREAQMKQRLRPQRSVNLPPGIMRIAMIRSIAVIVACTPSTVVSRSSRMSLIITFMFEPA